MDSLNGAFAGLPAAAVVGIAVLIVVQLALQVTALVQLVRTPAARVTVGGRKWVWALIIVLGEIAGAIVWFIVGRKPASVEVSAGASDADRARRVADALYPEHKADE